MLRTKGIVNDILNALLKALVSLSHPRILMLVLWPALGAILLWGGLSIYFWQDWVHLLNQLVAKTPLQDMLARHEVSWIVGYVATFLLILLLTPLILSTALLIASVVAMPVMVNHVARRQFPALEMRYGGTVLGSFKNMLIALLTYCLLWLITLPFWLFGPFAILIPILLTAYLNQRLFRYDALAQHASPEEFQQILERAGRRLYLLGAILALLHFIPVVNLFSPIYVGLAFIHFCLSELERLRRIQD